MRKGKTSNNYSPPRLIVPREEAMRRIREQIGIGRDIRDQKMLSMMDLESAQERRTEWLEKNVQILTRLFNNPSFAEEYNGNLSFDMDSAITFTLKEKYFKDDINEQIGRLESFLDRLKLIPEMKAEELAEQRLVEEPMEQEQPEEIQHMEVQLRETLSRALEPREEPPKAKLPKEELLNEVPHKRELLREEPISTTVLDHIQLQEKNILLIHGRDEGAKESALKFIEKLELRALILHEQPNEGKSILEKFEEAPNANFAIILFTPDDIIAPRNKPKEKQACASQNVIFEFGYFVGKLGKGRVCALYKEGVAFPLDYPGVVYIPMDSRGGWRLLVAKEIKQAGIEIDLNKAV